MKVMFKIYDGSKYTSTETPKTCESEITGYEVRTISDEEIEKMGFDCPDENKEYLIVHYVGFDWDDESGIGMMRNSHVDMFRI